MTQFCQETSLKIMDQKMKSDHYYVFVGFFFFYIGSSAIHCMKSSPWIKMSFIFLSVNVI